MEYQKQGTFDDLNNALFAQLDRLATNVVNNMNNAVQVARILADEGMDVSGIRATMPRMLGAGGE